MATAPSPDKPAELVPVELEHRLREAVGRTHVEPRKRDEVTRVVTAVLAEFFSGPLPHPSHLREYEGICPGAADRILTMAEKEQASRHRSRSQDFWYGMVGQGAGLIFALAAIAAAVLTAYLGHDWVAAGLGSVGVVGAVTHFIRGNKVFGRSDPPAAQKHTSGKVQQTKRKRQG